MKLDLEQMARARQANFCRADAMDYLLSPIRRELEQRIGDVAGKPGNSLVIDFADGDLLAIKESVSRCSLLEGVRDLAHKDQSFDLVAMNLQSSWLDFSNVLIEIKRLLRPGGVFHFSAFGPDTLAEVQYSWSKIDDLFHVHPFEDMQTLGDAMLKTGFVRPIVDADRIFVDYSDAALLFQDLKRNGFTNIFSDRRKSLTGKQKFKVFLQELDNIAGTKATINITYEIIYGFARVDDLPEGAIRVNSPIIAK